MAWVQQDDGDGGFQMVWQEDAAPSGMKWERYDGGGEGGYDSRLVADTSKYDQVRSAKGGEILEIFNPDTGEWEPGVYDIANPSIRLPASVARQLGIRSAPAQGHVAGKGNLLSELASDPNFVQFALTSLGGAYSSGAFGGGSAAGAGAGAAESSFGAMEAAADAALGADLTAAGYGAGGAVAGGATTFPLADVGTPFATELGTNAIGGMMPAAPPIDPSAFIGAGGATGGAGLGLGGGAEGGALGSGLTGGGAELGAGELIGGASSQAVPTGLGLGEASAAAGGLGGISTGLSGAGAAGANSALGLGSGSVLGDVGGAVAGGGLSQGTLSELSKMFPNATAGNILSALGNYFQQSNLGDSLENIANKAIDASNPFKQPERQPFIGMNSELGMESLLRSPQGFLDNDPFIKSMKQGIGEQAQANFAKSGNLPREAILSSAQVGNSMADAYKDRLGLTSVLGGYTMNNPYAGSVYSQGAGDGAYADAGAWSGLGTLFGQNPTQGAQNNPGTSNPGNNIFNFVGSLLGS